MFQDFTHTNESGESTTVYLSDEMAEYVGAFAQEFAVWANTQMSGKVVIVTPEDIHRMANSVDADNYATDVFVLKQSLQHIPGFPVDAFEVQAERAFIFGNTDPYAPQAILVNSDYALITTFPLGTQKSEIAHVFGGRNVSESQIENLEGTDFEWQISVIAHEIGHLDQTQKIECPVGRYTLSKGDFPSCMVPEIDAEQDMHFFMADAHHKGLINDIGFLDNMTSTRSFNFSNFSGELSHDVWAGVQTQNEGFAPVGEYADFNNGLYTAQLAIGYRAGQGTFDEHEARNRILQYQLNADYRLGEVLQNVDDSNIIQTAWNNQNITPEEYDQLSEEAKAAFDEKVRLLESHKGKDVLRDNPTLFYETARQAYQAGDLDDNPIGKQYAYEFLVTAQKHAPSHFGVADVDEKFVPPVFPDSGLTSPFETPSSQPIVKPH